MDEGCKYLNIMSESYYIILGMNHYTCIIDLISHPWYYLEEALNLIDNMDDANIISWIVVMEGYAQNGYFERALELFEKLPHQNIVSWNAINFRYAHSWKWFCI